jgi:hypothetical protein
MLLEQTHPAFWRRHRLLTAAGLLWGAWLLVNGWYLTVALVAGLVLTLGLRRRSRARSMQRAGLRARADFEYRFAVSGDPRGIYGRFPPVQAGWFPDPRDRRLLRYFDGAAWSGYTVMSRQTSGL